MQIIIDLHPGKPGEEQNIQTLLEELSKAGYVIQEGQNPKVFQEKAKLIIVETDTKRFYFLNSYFPVVYGFVNKRQRPLSIQTVLNHLDELLGNCNSLLRDGLYERAFAEFQKDSITRGY